MDPFLRWLPASSVHRSQSVPEALQVMYNFIG